VSPDELALEVERLTRALALAEHENVQLRRILHDAIAAQRDVAHAIRVGIDSTRTRLGELGSST